MVGTIISGKNLANQQSVLLLRLLALKLKRDERGMTHVSVAPRALLSSPRKSHTAAHL